MWLQVVGKVKLVHHPFLNEWWSAGFEVTPRGISTGLVPYGERAFDVEFDFIAHNLHARSSDGAVKSMSLVPRSVAAFYADFMAMLSGLGIEVRINTTPAEVLEPVAFEEDHHRSSYDPEYANRWWRVLLGTTRVLQRYRSSFFGKSSPILFYWGSFDLATARYSGRPAPPMEGVPELFRVAEDQENAACGFWPGSPSFSGFTLGEPAFYAYMIPAPQGYAEAQARPAEAYYHTDLGEFILPYEAVRTSPDPEGAMLEFFRSTYEAGARLADWQELPSPFASGATPGIPSDAGQEAHHGG